MRYQKAGARHYNLHTMLIFDSSRIKAKNARLERQLAGESKTKTSPGTKQVIHMLYMLVSMSSPEFTHMLLLPICVHFQFLWFFSENSERENISILCECGWRRVHVCVCACVLTSVGVCACFGCVYDDVSISFNVDDKQTKASLKSPAKERNSRNRRQIDDMDDLIGDLQRRNEAIRTSRSWKA